MKNLIIFLLFIFIFSNCNRIPEGYVKYQTFDEFTLQGVPFRNNELIEPFILLKSREDTIKILICERYKKQILIEYINHGSYWYNVKKEQEKYHPTCKCDTTPHYTERFLFKDTILEYSYYLKNKNKKFLERLELTTKSSIISLASSTGFSVMNDDNKFQHLKHFFRDYRNKFEHCEPSLYQSRFYNYYRRELVGDTLFIYENIGNKIDKYGSLIDARKLSSLGEFDIDNGKSVLNDIFQKEKKN